MSTLYGFFILLGCLYAGQLASAIIPLPVPGVIYGFLILFLLLSSNVVRLSSVDNLSEGLITLMLFMFVPGGVNILKVLHLMEGQILVLLIIVVASTAITMSVTALTVDKIIDLQRRLKDGF